ncbi:MAG: low molecular weight phosphatase family protein [Candidatus Paceibacterota bacterium]|jgi:protein-tyrosine-phosphatase
MIKKFPKILFVCNGNIFRSFSAEVLLQKYLRENKIRNWKIQSAGIYADPKVKVFPEILENLKKLGAKSLKHRPHKINKITLKKFDLVICMAKNQIDFLKENFDYKKAKLFNDVALNKKTSIWDIDDMVKNWKTNKKAVDKYTFKTIKYINDNIPKLVKNMIKKYD